MARTHWESEAAAAGASVEGAGLVRLALATPTLPPATATNHYFVGWRPMVIVDPSAPAARDQRRLGAAIDAARACGAEPAALLLTHHHRDHAGAAALLRRATGLPVWAHAETARWLQAEVVVDRTVVDGDDVAHNADGAPWLALFTPGHAPGHLALHQPGSGQVVAGDLVAGEGTILVDPSDGDMGLYLQSLARLEALAPRSLAPAHGPVQRDALALLQHYQAHRRAREARVLEALATTPRPAADLLPTAYGDVSRLAWPLALRSMTSHLLHLQRQGLARPVDGGWSLA
ncbi:MAG: MBL fold metallo-hydrolase [Deltaproteobacteria bacterium]|nr:MBL fold metallo-hydrolase [Deltaproteobacteria bacterium]